MSDTSTIGDPLLRSFGLAAEDHDRYRLAPPAEALEWVLLPGAGTVAHIGPETGAVARALTARCGLAVAVESGPCRVAPLRPRPPAAIVVTGVAESLPLADESLDAAVVSGAWHGLDPALATAELARVLRPGGMLGMLGNGIDPRQRWAYDLLEGQRTPTDVWPRPEPASEHYPPDLLPRSAAFGPAQTRRVPWSVNLTPEQVAGLAGTSPDALALAPDARYQRLQRVASLARTHRQLDPATGAIRLPLVCRCWRATRL